MIALVKLLTFVSLGIASIFAVSSLGDHSYRPGDLVRIEQDDFKAVYRVEKLIDNKADPVYELIATDEAGLLPYLAAPESAMRPATSPADIAR